MSSDSLAAMSTEPQAMTVGGRTYKCGPWEMGDYAKVERVIRGERRNELLESMRFKMLDAEIIALSLAAVQNNTISLRDVLTCQSARTELLRLNLLRNDPTVTEDHVGKLSPIVARDLFDFMSELSGLLPAGMAKAGDADPTSTTSTTPTERET